jgi:prohibitin 1
MSGAREAGQRVGNLLNVLAKVSVAGGLGISLLSASLYTVEGGQRAVIFNRYSGVEQKVIGEGTHFRIPWLQTPHFFDVRTRPSNIGTSTGSRDLQTVNITLRVLYRPKMNSLPTIFSNLGVDFGERVIPSIGNEVLKAVVAQYDASELIVRRDVVSQEIREQLMDRSEDFNIVFDDISITHLSFGKEFTSAIEQKQVAQQAAERAKFVVAKAEQEQRAVVLKAEGEAQAAALISAALQESGTGLLELRRIEAARDIAATLSRSKNVTYLPQSGNVLMNVGTA